MKRIKCIGNDLLFTVFSTPFLLTREIRSSMTTFFCVKILFMDEMIDYLFGGVINFTSRRCPSS